MQIQAQGLRHSQFSTIKVNNNNRHLRSKLDVTKFPGFSEALKTKKRVSTQTIQDTNRLLNSLFPKHSLQDLSRVLTVRPSDDKPLIYLSLKIHSQFELPLLTLKEGGNVKFPINHLVRWESVLPRLQSIFPEIELPPGVSMSDILKNSKFIESKQIFNIDEALKLMNQHNTSQYDFIVSYIHILRKVDNVMKVLKLAN